MSSEPIATLIDIQAKEQLTDRQMAERLGCSRQLWQMTRTGRTPLSNTIIRCITKNFPELHLEVIYFLAQSADKLSKVGDK